MKARAQARPMPLLPPVMRTFLPLSWRSMSVRCDAFRLDDSGQALRLLGEVLACFLWRSDEGLEGLRLELLHYVLRVERGIQGGVDTRDDGRRRLGRREQLLPLRELKILDASLVHGGHIREQR